LLRTIEAVNRKEYYRKLSCLGIKVETTKTSAMIKRLEACEEYLVDVGVIGPFGMGPMSSPKQIQTAMDERAPPKELQIRTTNDILSLVLAWKAPCPALEKPIAYNVSGSVFCILWLKLSSGSGCYI
jgi:hypothetical protein